MILKEQILPLEIFYIYFSPYTAHALEIDGLVYPTVEHAYQCQRYTDQKIIAEIIEARSPLQAWETSCKYKHLQIADFRNPEYKVKVMKALMKTKVSQHSEVKEALINSGELKIVKHIVTYPPGDGFWDDGNNGEGDNWIGRIWMEIRGGLPSKLLCFSVWSL